MSISPIDFPVLPSLPGINNAQVLPGASPAAGVEGPTSVGRVGGVEGSGPAGGAEFGSMLLDGLDRLEGLTDKADALAVQAATGKLENIHDYTIAASEAQVASQLTVAVRNKGIEAFNEIMRMQV